MRILCASLAMAIATAAFASPKVSEYPDAVADFNKACLVGELTMLAREAAITADGWTARDNAGIDVAAFNISRAIEKNYDFAKPESVKAFERQINGQEATLLLASYPAKRRYQILCALVVREVDNAFMYHDALDAAFKARGIKGKSVDLPHYFEWADKDGPEKNPVRGEVFTRSQVFGGKRDMHIYAAF